MKILFASKDIGGTEMLAQIVKRIMHSHEFIYFAEDKSREILRKSKIEFFAVEESGNNMFGQMAGFNPDIVVTGTSIGNSIENHAIEFARKNDCLSVSLIDYWSNYWLRFKVSNQTVLPDIICVIDDIMRDEMIEAGFDKSIIVITGNPHFDNFTEDIGNSSEHKQILFISQPISELKDKIAYPGYDEFTVLSDLLDAVKTIDSLKTEYRLLIRPHPRSKSRKFDKIIKKEDELNINLDKNPHLLYSISTSQIIVGMSSMVLFQAALSNKFTISYQPNMTGLDNCILSKLGISDTLNEKKDLIKKLELFTADETRHYAVSKDIIDRYINGNSTGKVVELIESMVKNG